MEDTSGFTIRCQNVSEACEYEPRCEHIDWHHSDKHWEIQEELKKGEHDRRCRKCMCMNKDYEDHSLETRRLEAKGW